MDDRRCISLELCFHTVVTLLLNRVTTWFLSLRAELPSDMPDFVPATSPGPLDVVLPLPRRGLRVLAPPAVAWAPSMTPADHARALGVIRTQIEAGNTYQVNHTMRWRARSMCDTSNYSVTMSGRCPHPSIQATI